MIRFFSSAIEQSPANECIPEEWKVSGRLSEP